MFSGWITEWCSFMIKCVTLSLMNSLIVTMFGSVIKLRTLCTSSILNLKEV